MRKIATIVFYALTFILAFCGICTLILLSFGFVPIQVETSILNWNAISAISAFVSAISTALYLIATILILKENQKTNALAKKQYDKLILPNIVADFYIEHGYDIRLAVKNEGQSSATNVKIMINFLDEWINFYRETQHCEYLSMSCEELKNNTFTLVPNKEKYFCIGTTQYSDILKDNVVVTISYDYLGKKQETLYFKHNLKLYGFLNGDKEEPLKKLDKSIDDLTRAITDISVKNFTNR